MSRLKEKLEPALPAPLFTECLNSLLATSMDGLDFGVNEYAGIV